MKFWLRKETYSKHAEEFKIASKMNYDANPTRKLVTACARYKINPEEKKAASVARYKINPEKQKTAYVARYKINPEKQKAASVARYKINPEKQKAASVARYKINPEKQKTAYVARYKINPEKQKAASVARYKINPEKQKTAYVARYKINPEKQKAASVARYKINPEKQKAASVARYKINPGKQKAASVARYKINPEKQKAASIAKYKTKSKQLKSIFKTNYAENKKSICEYRRSMYVLAEPKPDVKQQYVKQIQYSLLHDSQTLVQLIKDYKKQHPDLAKRMSRAMSQAVCKIAAKKVLNKALQLRKENVGYLLKNIRLIKCLDIKENEDFGEGVHSAASEPYYFDASYRLVKIDFPIPVDENGKCMLTTENPDNEIEKHTNKPLKWQCYSQCKPLTIAEVNAVVTLKEEFQKPIKEVCDDGCPNEHFSKSVEASPNNDIYLDCYAVDREGHPLVCFNDSNCVSKLKGSIYSLSIVKKFPACFI